MAQLLDKAKGTVSRNDPTQTSNAPRRLEAQGAGWFVVTAETGPPGRRIQRGTASPAA
jgi:hypothetical protein